ncbi:hypothetical protein [Pseudomonas panipatensis]|uniref:Uncharacterized protein n=1 Tax=Pseudomonas panipatensis TaxID=428992 RepID=A0A1G8N8U9_9PSED|nr:hypothetical protein [Pseudomonas panipatensis]SDI75970.1 hypothetical protein SAMN05216272_1213 [Pseudomonas panipatensis]SMP45560.1 hypothetical protein SAMN06295951_101993 [Pseudomonas panipatensis]
MISKFHYSIRSFLLNASGSDRDDADARSVERFRADIGKVGAVVPYKIIVPEREYLTTLKGEPDPLVRVAGDSAIQFYFPRYGYRGPNVFALSEATLRCFSRLEEISRAFNDEVEEGEAVVEVWNTSPIKEKCRRKAVVLKEYLVLSFSDDEINIPGRRLALTFLLNDSGLRFDAGPFNDLILAAVDFFGGDAEIACDWLFKKCLGLGGRPCDGRPEDVIKFIRRLENGIGV